jgi:hypothetical protein
VKKCRAAIISGLLSFQTITATALTGACYRAANTNGLMFKKSEVFPQIAQLKKGVPLGPSAQQRRRCLGGYPNATSLADCDNPVGRRRPALARTLLATPCTQRGKRVNVSRPRLQATILTRRRAGASQREIERVAGIDRKAIRTCDKRFELAP